MESRMSEAKIDLIVLSGPSRGDTFHFNVNESGCIAIGRDASCDLVLAYPNVSRKHATVSFLNGHFYLTDTNSSGGTIHMGFRLESGDMGKSILSGGEEFKIGETLFRVQFDKSFEPSKSQAQQVVDNKASKQGLKEQSSKPYPARKKLFSKQIVLLFILVVALLIVFFLVPKQKKRIQDNNVISLPRDGVVGYLGGKGKKGEVDVSHPDKASFKVGASDVLIEYDFMSESLIRILLDKFEVETLEPNRDGWQHRQIIIRDVAIGQDRTLVFDNLGYPLIENNKGNTDKRKTKPTKWAVRNVRISPLSRIENAGFDAKLANAIGLSDTLDKTPSSLFDVQRALQLLILDLMDELKIEAIGVDVSLESEHLKSPELLNLLNGMKSDRAGGMISSEVGDRHLRVLDRVVGRLDAELWRRVNSRLNAAELSSDTKDFIGAHDVLVGTIEMFSDKGDWRRVSAEKMLADNKIVPRKVRQEPSKYRRRSKAQ